MWRSLLASSEYKALSICHHNPELIVYVLSWSRLSVIRWLGSRINKPHRMNWGGGQVSCAFNYFGLVQVIIVDYSLTTESHISLIKEDQAFLAESASHQDGTSLRLLHRCGRCRAFRARSSCVNDSWSRGSGTDTALEVVSVYLLCTTETGCWALCVVIIGQGTLRWLSIVTIPCRAHRWALEPNQRACWTNFGETIWHVCLLETSWSSNLRRLVRDLGRAHSFPVHTLEERMTLDLFNAVKANSQRRVLRQKLLDQIFCLWVNVLLEANFVALLNVLISVKIRSTFKWGYTTKELVKDDTKWPVVTGIT